MALGPTIVEKLKLETHPLWPWLLIGDSMNHCVTFYLPSQKADGTELPQKLRDNLSDSVMNFLLNELGGATRVQGEGFFAETKNAGKKNEQKYVHQESVVLCRAFCSAETLKKHGWKINQMANSMAIEFFQFSIAVEVDGGMYFYSPNEGYRAIYAENKKKWAKDKDPRGYFKYIDMALPPIGQAPKELV